MFKEAPLPESANQGSSESNYVLPIARNEILDDLENTLRNISYTQHELTDKENVAAAEPSLQAFVTAQRAICEAAFNTAYPESTLVGMKSQEVRRLRSPFMAPYYDSQFALTEIETIGTTGNSNTASVVIATDETTNTVVGFGVAVLSSDNRFNHSYVGELAEFAEQTPENSSTNTMKYKGEVATRLLAIREDELVRNSVPQQETASSTLLPLYRRANIPVTVGKEYETGIKNGEVTRTEKPNKLVYTANIHEQDINQAYRTLQLQQTDGHTVKMAA